MKRGLLGLGLLLLVLAGGATPARAVTSASLAVRTLDTTGWPNVKMTVQYTGRNKPQLADFVVRDHGQIVQGITARPLSETAAPIGVVLVIDVSGSMREAGRMQAAKTAAEVFVSGRGATEKIAVVAFNDAAVVAHPFSADKGASSAIAGLTPAGGTALWDAVRLATGLFAGETDVQPNIVVLSDGADSASVGSAQDARNAAIAAHAVVHTVGFASNALDGAGLTSLAQATGGQALVTNSATNVTDLFGEIRRSLDEQYELAWKATGAQRTLDLNVSVRDATTAASGAAGSVSHERNTRPETIPEPGGIRRITNAVGRPLAVLGVAAVAVLIVLGVAFHLGEGQGLARRLRAYQGGDPSQPEAEDEQLGMSLATNAVTTRVVDAAAAAMEGKGVLEWVERKLDAARLPVRAAEAAFFVVAFAFVLSGLGFAVGGLMLGVLAFGLGLGVPTLVLSFLGYHRKKKFVRQLPGMLQLLASSLRAGYALLQGCEAVAREMEDPMGAELRRVLAEARLGRELDEALEEAAIRMESADFSWVVMAISIQRSVGGNLAELLDTVSDTMTQRNRLRREVKALTAEGRMSAIMLGIMPPALAVAMMVMSPGYLDPLFEKRPGQIMLGGGIVMMVAGFAWMQKIIKLDV